MRVRLVLAGVVAVTASGCTTTTGSRWGPAEEGCDHDVGRIVFTPLRTPSPLPASGGPALLDLRTGRLDADFIGTPPFMGEAGGLPLRGQVHSKENHSAYYGDVPIDGLDYEDFLDAGGLVLTSHQGDAKAQKVLDKLPGVLPRVRIGTAYGWVNRHVNWFTGRISHVVVWVTEDNQHQTLSGFRDPEELVAIARSLVCAEPE